MSLNYVAFILLGILHLSATCFITNCPSGGKKRSDPMIANNNNRPLKQCAKCGPEYRGGRCFGPNLCCGEFGCLFGTVETLICQKEDYSPIPCLNDADPCTDVVSNGQCVLPGYCCNGEGDCKSTPKCDSVKSFLKSSPSSLSQGIPIIKNNIMEEEDVDDDDDEEEDTIVKIIDRLRKEYPQLSPRQIISQLRQYKKRNSNFPSNFHSRKNNLLLGPSSIKKQRNSNFL